MGSVSTFAPNPEPRTPNLESQTPHPAPSTAVVMYNKARGATWRHIYLEPLHEPSDLALPWGREGRETSHGDSSHTSNPSQNPEARSPAATTDAQQRPAPMLFLGVTLA
jgi:hypothetical protein